MTWTRDINRDIIAYKAARDVVAGEELCIDYGRGLWFEDVELCCGDDGRRAQEGDGDEEGEGGLRRIEPGCLTEGRGEGEGEGRGRGRGRGRKMLKEEKRGEFRWVWF